MAGAVDNVLVVGAGVAGGTVAGFLARRGVTVEVAEVMADVTALGSGITVQGNALRVLREFGVWDEVHKAGYPFNTTGIQLPNGTVVAEMDDLRTGGPDLPATMGMERRDLAGIIVGQAEADGATFRFGTTVEAIASDDDGADVTFSDGTTGRYDLVIGADGLKSKVRDLIGVPDRPQPTGMGIWRIFTSRPASITRTDLCFAGPCYIAGYCPTSEDSIYAYLVEDNQDRSGMTPEEKLKHVRSLAENYHGPWDDIKDLMTSPDSIHYTWFDQMLIDGPWWRGRAVLIGDAAHTCPPTIAQGAAQALEDALVLAESLTAHTEVGPALDAFLERRFERAKAVVEASVQVGQWMIDDDPDGDIPGTMHRTLAMLAEPA